MCLQSEDPLLLILLSLFPFPQRNVQMHFLYQDVCNIIIAESVHLRPGPMCQLVQFFTNQF
ncbi:hypothetical protein PILCRDRAFT_820861 [Piloderma croceum F 1598]|uniref:Uncharacterized protein n=1 Tax=Piloderma croceum (strain F 1598) TaxID=765440 RepID=A0A0C3FBA7_PILCF|nr:hypothetical protein PILCRDRAFT_820861 [Piloderma croceum F 1598]